MFQTMNAYLESPLTEQIAQRLRNAIPFRDKIKGRPETHPFLEGHQIVTKVMTLLRVDIMLQHQGESFLPGPSRPVIGLLGRIMVYGPDVINNPPFSHDHFPP